MKTNAGFEIRKTEMYSENHGVALGYNSNAMAKWVTWEFTEFEDNTEDYYWGHYFEDSTTALRDFHMRLALKYEDLPF